MTTPLTDALDEVIELIEDMKEISESNDSDAVQAFLERAEDVHRKLAAAVTMAMLAVIHK